ncbi:DUF368 domain-containing protein [Desulfospira joergensenii]|uniref:DUF368 domain-containing protein n=1 Tax=Desulfospira joergensenii TaxID=53329 RepID=UPI0003B6AEBA|nr:DUF368 domain-containing protein [Desulfospira joergensenii]
MKEKGSRASLVKELLMGFCLGTANIIPGVSGGTFLLIFKIYERVFAVLDRITRATLLTFSGLIFSLVKEGGSRAAFKALGDFLRENDFLFLFKLIAGAVAAILALSSLMKYLLIHHFSMTYSLFFGLILVSVIIPVKMIRSRRAGLIFWAVLGAGLTLMVACQVNPYDKVKIKSDHYKLQYEQTEAKDPGALPVEKGQPVSTGKYTGKEYAYAVFCGAVSISAMVLPGISGSLVLILMGAYFDVISAISALKDLHLEPLLFLGSFGMGLVFGGLLFAKLINYVLRRHYDSTMAFLTGLMGGSLYALWPFKKVMIMAEQYVKQDGGIAVLNNVSVYTNINILPQSGVQTGLSLLFFCAGCAVMYGFVRLES